VFYNTSKWTLNQLSKTATNNQQILLANVEEYLNGYSANVKEIIDKFNLKAQVRHMAGKDVLLDVLEKFTLPYINLTPHEVEDPDGNRLPALTNLGMGYVFEELIRKFNEDNNEEAGEHFTPREVIELMTHLVFDPVKDKLPPVMTIYDPACGSGGMLTESQNFIKDEDGAIRATGDVYLYGKEINDETYAICKSDMMIKGNNPANIRVGSTLSIDKFAGIRFDFILSNPPYGKSWASEQKYIKDGSDVIDPRFRVTLKDYWGSPETVDATPRSSDGQLLFLMEMVSKMKSLDQSPYGSRIASVHNGSSLFTGDAGSGESNIRRHIIENDLLEAIIQLPNNLFYNTGITTYIWLLSNHKPDQRKGKVQMIDASQLTASYAKTSATKTASSPPSISGKSSAPIWHWQLRNAKLMSPALPPRCSTTAILAITRSTSSGPTAARLSSAVSASRPCALISHCASRCNGFTANGAMPFISPGLWPIRKKPSSPGAMKMS
jgi:type I restriction enzyme M protein